MDIREIYGHPGAGSQRGLSQRVKEMINDIDKKRREATGFNVAERRGNKRRIYLNYDETDGGRRRGLRNVIL